MAGPDTVPVRTVHSVQRVGRRAVGTPVVLAVGVVALLLVAVLARDHLPAVSAVQGAVQARVLQLRALGPGLPVAFVLAHAVVTVTPVPRTTFTLAAGVLFGPVVGVALTVLGATASAVLALLLVRAVGRDAVAAIVPGTISLVLLGSAVGGRSSPWVLGVGAACGVVGVLGLVLDARTPVKP